MKKYIAMMMSLVLGWSLLGSAQTYRTFTADELTVKKAEPKTVSYAMNMFSFTNTNSAPVDGIYIEFTSEAKITGTSDESLQYNVLTGSKSVWQIYGNGIANNEKVDVRVLSATKGFKIKTWCWMYGSMQVGNFRTNQKPMATFKLLQSPMPNTANVREVMYSQKGTVVTVGIPRPDKKREFGWVEVKSSGNFIASLLDKEATHFGQARGFARLGNGALMTGVYKKLTPSLMNNKLFADLLSLKFSILASDMGYTPYGLGDLYYSNEASSYNGMRIRDIVAHADSLMTFWKGVLKVTYQELDEVIASINDGFSGPIDTISYRSRLRLTGVAAAENVPFISKTGRAPVIAENVNTLPVLSALEQNYPNPFNPTTTINFSLEQESNVSLKVFNMLGQEVASLLNGEVAEEGTNEVVFNADNLSSGTYFYQIIAKGVDNQYSFEKTMKMTLTK